MPMIEILDRNILESGCRAITNSANASLVGMGGVSGAILRAGGPSMVRELEARGPAELGDVVVTPGYDTGFEHVLHAVADPDYRPVGTYAIYASIIATAERLGVESLALPAIGMGIFSYPPDAVEVSVRAVVEAGRLSSLDRIEFCILDEAVTAQFREVLGSLG